MDPLSIAASIVALCTAAKSCHKLAKSAYRTSVRVKTAQDDIYNFSRDVHLFGDVLLLACNALEPFQDEESQQRPVIQYLVDKKVLDQLSKMSDRLLRELDDYIPAELRDLRNTWKLVTRFRWVSQRKEIEAMGPKMESLKCSFNLVLNSVLLETVRLQPRTEGNSREM